MAEIIECVDLFNRCNTLAIIHSDDKVLHDTLIEARDKITLLLSTVNRQSLQIMIDELKPRNELETRINNLEEQLKELRKKHTAYVSSHPDY